MSFRDHDNIMDRELNDYLDSFAVDYACKICKKDVCENDMDTEFMTCYACYEEDDFQHFRK
jgi:hypothetical protein